MSEPSNDAFEKAALGTALNRAEGLEVVVSQTSAGFYANPAHRAVYLALVELSNQGLTETPLVIVGKHLESKGELAAIGGHKFLMDIAEADVAQGSMAKIVRDLRANYAAREMSRVGTEIAEKGQGFNGLDPSSVAQDVEEAIRMFGDLAASAIPHDWVNIQTVLKDTYKNVTEPEEQEVFATGFRDLDDLMQGGMRSGQLVIVAARPATGKSVASLNILSHLAINKGVGCVMFSLEMSTAELGIRLLAAQARVPLDVLNGGKLNEDELDRVNSAIFRIGDSPLYVDDTPGLDISEITAKARQLARKGVRVLVVDYVQLIRAKAVTSRGGSRQEEVSEVSRALKVIAKTLNMVVIAVAQLNRGPESRTDKRPQTADLRESGQLEQDADTVILLHREDMYDVSDGTRGGEVDFIVSKHRNGPTATIPLAFQGHFSRMVDMARE